MLCQIFTNSDTVYLFVPYIHSHTNVAQIILGTRRITWRACIHVAMLHIYLFSHTPYVCLHLTLGEDHWVLNTRLDEVAFALQ